jgi:WXG100 family type VII secretion target
MVERMQFTVTGVNLTIAATQCLVVNDDIQTKVVQITNYIHSFEASYSGPTATILQGVIDKWQTDANNLSTVLKEIASNLNRNARNYEDNETQNLSNVTAIGASLPAGNF